MTKNIYLETTSAWKSSDILFMTYNTYLIPQIDDLELREWLIHPDGGSTVQYLQEGKETRKSKIH